MQRNTEILQRAREAKARYAKERKDAEALATANASIIPGLLPAGGQFVVPQIQEHVAYWNALTKVFPNPDEAYKKGRDQQRHMLNSVWIHEPLQARLLSVAELPFHLEPENQKDEEQQEVCRELTKIIEEIPDWLQYKYWLSMAIWFGRSATQNKYRWDFSTGKKRMVMDKWRPVNGDSLVFKWDNDDYVGVLVLPISMGDGTKDLTDAKLGPEARYHQLTDWEREAFVIHKHQIFAYDFWAADRAGAYKGLGLRHWLFYPWHLCSQLESWLNQFTEKCMFGQTIFRFQGGNRQSEDQVRKMAEAQAFKLTAIWPAFGDQNYKDIERLETNPQGAEVALRVMIDWYAGSIKRFILGQTLSSEASKTTAGNETAKFQQQTLEKLTLFDATNLEETLTHQLVNVLLKYNYPEATFKVRFKFNVEKEDPREVLASAREFYNLGGTIDENELRSKIGLSAPTADSQILKRPLTGMEAAVMGGEDAPPPPEGEKPEEGGESQSTKIDAIKKAMDSLGANAKAGDIMSHLQSSGLSVSRSLVYRTLQGQRGSSYTATGEV